MLHFYEVMGLLFSTFHVLKLAFKTFMKTRARYFDDNNNLILVCCQVMEGKTLKT